MDLKNHCLFCLEQIVPYSTLGEVKVDVGGGAEINSQEEGEGGSVPDFQSLCRYLKISFPEMENIARNLRFSPSSSAPLTCDKFLCIGCFEMVEQLSKLYKKLEEIQGMIGETTGRIREVVVAHDISPNVSSLEGGRRREEFKKKVGLGRRRRCPDGECLAFVEMFQTLVASLDDTTDTRKEDDTSRISLIDAVEVKTEVVKEDLIISNCGGDDDHKLFTDLESEMLNLSPREWKGDPGELDGSLEMKEDAEWKPDGDMPAAVKPKSRRSKTLKQEPKADTSSKRGRGRPRLQRNSSGAPLGREEGPPKQYKCVNCNLIFPTWKKRLEHRRKSHPKKSSNFKSFAVPQNLPIVKSLIASIPTVAVKKTPGMQANLRIYVCTVCGEHIKEYNTKLLNYMEHMLSHEYSIDPEEAAPFSCPDCDKQFNLKINLELHKVCIHDTKQVVIRCDLCTGVMEYETGEELIQHLKTDHGGTTIHSCRHCPISYISFERLLVHMLKHRKCRALLCPECATICTTVKELQKHCHQFHPDLKETFNCEMCDKFYLSTASIRHHMRKDHGFGFDPKTNTFVEDNGNLAGVNLTCPHCESDNGRKNRNKIYKTQLALKTHIKSTHGRKTSFPCDQCGDKLFASKANLRFHIEAFHEKIRYPCPHCPKSYTEAAQLNYHMRTHTGEGLLICHICSKQFPQMNQLKAHLKTHSTIQPEYKRVCEECGKECPNEYKLAKHKENVHPKEKRECPVCGLVLKRADHLRSHMRTHTGERPFQCPACKKGFNRRDILRIHVKGVHRMELAEAQEKYKGDTTD